MEKYQQFAQICDQVVLSIREEQLRQLGGNVDLPDGMNIERHEVAKEIAFLRDRIERRQKYALTDDPLNLPLGS